MRADGQGRAEDRARTHRGAPQDAHDALLAPLGDVHRPGEHAHEGDAEAHDVGTDGIDEGVSVHSGQVAHAQGEDQEQRRWEDE